MKRKTLPLRRPGKAKPKPRKSDCLCPFRGSVLLFEKRTNCFSSCPTTARFRVETLDETNRPSYRNRYQSRLAGRQAGRLPSGGYLYFPRAGWMDGAGKTSESASINYETNRFTLERSPLERRVSLRIFVSVFDQFVLSIEINQRANEWSH